jgi:5-methylcytosine-specific restriction endonuclease McrA
MPILVSELEVLPFGIEEERRQECYSYYSKRRIATCGPHDYLNLSIADPLCDDCFQPNEFDWSAIVSPSTWPHDLAWQLGQWVVDRTRAALRRDRSFGFVCRGCLRTLRPWRDQSVHVLKTDFEDWFGLSESSRAHPSKDRKDANRKNPSSQMTHLVMKLYGRACFGCGEPNRGLLGVDHIRPRALEGASFRNLQPLCERCGVRKDNRPPSEIFACDNTFFGSLRSECQVS